MTANELLGWRTRRGWSQAALARRLGVSNSMVSRWEAGRAVEHPRLLWLALWAIEHGALEHEEDADGDATV